MTHKTIAEMTNDEFMKHVVEDCLQGWIPLKTYLRLFGPEETKVAVESRIRRGFWKKGVQFHTPKGTYMWVNLHAIREWVTASLPEPVEPSGEPLLASEHAPETLGRRG